MYNNSYIPPASELPYGGICAVNPVVATIKRLGRSAMFLWICILQTVVAGLTLLNTILLSAGINLIEGLVDMSGQDVPDEIFEILEVTSASTGLAFVFPGLFALGFWLIRAACKSDGSPFVTTGGLTTMKVLITISLVMLYIVAGCIPFMILAFLFLLGSETDISPYIGEFDEGYIDDFSDFPAYEFESAFSGVFFGAMVIVLAIALVVLVVCIVYYHFLLRGMNTLKENCEGILSDRSFPMFVVVWLYIMAGCSFVTALLSLSLVSVATGAVSLLGAILMGKYRKEMERLRIMSAASAEPMNMPEEPPVASAPQSMADSPVQETVGYCSHCGRPMNGNEAFCARCGTPFSVE